MTIILVTNLVQQARRLADRTMFLLERRDRRARPPTEVISRTTPPTGSTYDYVNGIFG